MDRSSLEGAAARLRQALELHAAGIDMMRQTLRRRHPALAEEEIEQLLAQWVRQRPGAENGDGEGRVVGWNSIRR